VNGLPVSRTVLCCRSGAVLPMALLALLVLSLLAVALLLSATTEEILGRTHRAATQEVYAAEGAVHAWIALRDADLRPERVEGWVAPESAVPVRISVDRLAGMGTLGPHDGSALFSVRAEAATDGGGGRGVAAMMRVRPTHLPDWSPEIDAAVVAAAGASVSASGGGTAAVHDGDDHPRCVAVNPRATHALLLGNSRSLTVSGGGAVQGSVAQSSRSGDVLVREVLGGIGLRDLAWNAPVRFGRYFGEDPLPIGAEIGSGAADVGFDWGCPAEVVDAVSAAVSAAVPASAPRVCAAGADPARQAIVAIDAENRTVTLDQYHAQGILIVLNGSLHLRSGFLFRGLILAEGDVTVAGGSPGWPPSIEGAVVSGGTVRVQSGGGVRSLRFDRCAVDDARTAFNGPVPGAWGAPRLLGRPFGWFEIVR
jgi:hypothetical protein